MNELLGEITSQLAQSLGTGLEYRSHQPLFGGEINQAFLLNTASGTPLFIKINKASRLGMFEAELEALGEINRSNTLRAPHPILAGTAEGRAFLAMEYIEMGGGGRKPEEALGHGLAAMHQTRHPLFGWHRENTIGSTPQINRQERSWATFWREQRLAPQLRWVAEKGGSASLQQKGERLMEAVEQLLGGRSTEPSLLHGDLWGGNWSATPDGEPVIYDPALYYGDREADLAMTELFGGFSSRFHDAYNESWPLEPGYGQRKGLYNLYHILNHFNLFGGGYGHQAERMIDRLLPR